MPLRVRTVTAALVCAASLAACTADAVPTPPPPPAPKPYVRVDAAPDTFVAGAGFALLARAWYIKPDGTTDNSAPVVWSSSDTTVLKVKPNVVNYANIDIQPQIVAGYYSADIIAQIGDLVGRKTIVVKPDIQVFKIVPTTSLRAAGVMEALTYTLKVGARDPLTDPPIIWRSSDPSVIDVSASGVIAGKKPGTATITASLYYRSDSIVLNATDPYRIVSLDGLANQQASATQLNEHNDVLGWDVQRGYFLYHSGTITSLANCRPLDLNERGQVLCVSDIAGEKRLAIWDTGVLIPAAPAVTASDAGFYARFNSSGTIAYQLKAPGSSCMTCVWVQTAFGRDSLIPPIEGTLFRLDDAGNLTLSVSGGALRRLASTGEWDRLDLSRTLRSPGLTTVTPGGVMLINDFYTVSIGGTSWFSYFRLPKDSVQYIGPFQAQDINDRLEVVASGQYFQLGRDYRARPGDLTVDPVWQPTIPLRINGSGVILSQAVNKQDGRPGLVLMIPRN